MVVVNYNFCEDIINFTTNKEKGIAGLCMAIAYFGSNGYNVSIPLNDTQDYDLVVEKDGIFQSVQCKATGLIDTKGNYILTLKSSGGTKGVYYKTFIDTSVDLLFCLTGDGIMYLFPKDVITQKMSITLSKSRSKYANKECLDTSKYIIK